MTKALVHCPQKETTTISTFVFWTQKLALRRFDLDRFHCITNPLHPPHFSFCHTPKRFCPRSMWGPLWSWSYGSWILQLPVQSVSITTKVVSSNSVHGEVYLIRHRMLAYSKLWKLIWVIGGRYDFVGLLWLSVLLVEQTGVPGENHQPVASHWQTISHKVVSSTPPHEQSLNSQL
jgi:hypothetical protein